MDISTIANVATAITVLTGVIFGWFEVRHFRREREERAAKWKRQLHVFRSVSVVAGSLGALVGFLWQHESGDAATIALGSVGGAVVFAVGACLAVWLLDKVLGPGVGE